MSVGVAKGTLCGRTDHHVVATVELLKILCSLVPLAKVGIAKACIEVGKVACVGAAVLVSHAEEARETSLVAVEGFLVLLFSKELLALGEDGACLVGTRSCHISVIHDDACNDHNHCNDTGNDGLLVFCEEGFLGTDSLFRYLSAILIFDICHYYCILFCFQAEFRGKITEIIGDIEIYYRLFLFFGKKTRNFALKRRIFRLMILKTLTIVNFKNIGMATVEWSPKMNCLVGRNGMGKTNVLDAIYYLSFCRSISNPIDSQLIRHEEPYLMIEGQYATDDGEPETVACALKRGAKKRFKRNDKEYRKLADHIGLVPIVLVAPSDTNLIDGQSEDRRRLMDMVISQYDRLYMDSLVRYSKVLQQRNTLLKAEEEPDPALLDILEEQMAQEGETIYKARKAFIDEFLPVFNTYHNTIADSHDDVGLEYVSHCQRGPLIEVIRRDRMKDRCVGYSLHGVHRDDLNFTINGHPLKKEGSQGQNKTFAIALKLAQFDFLKRTASATTPILLLDDIFDKLDADRVGRIVDIVLSDNFGQTFITDTESAHLENILRGYSHDYRIYDVKEGEICLREM